MAANKPTAVHFSLIFFVMATIIAGVMAYMFYDDGRELRSEVAAAKAELDKQKTIAREDTAEVEALKAKIGHLFPEVGEDNPDAEGSVIKTMNDDLVKYAQAANPQQVTYTDALKDLRQQLDNSAANYQAEQQKTLQLDAAIKDLEKTYASNAASHDAARLSAVQSQQDALNEHQDALQKEFARYKTLNDEHQKLKVAMDQAKQAHEQVVADMQDRVNRLVSINNILQDRIKNATRTSFERADGLVRWVDNTSHLVWINLGSADKLVKRTNFSVYKRNNRGVGRDSESTLKGPEDLKGAIEVTRILGPHLAEARILDEDYYDPIAINDPIYTPIWSPNQTEAFAFVGLIDMDDDGISDRELLHDVLRSVNAKVQVEVDDKGERTGGPIDEKTKFLVVGKIPALEDLTDKDEKAAATKIHEQHKALKDEAREQGVRVVTLNDFMAFMGVKPRQRVFRPGDNRPYALRNGSASTATSQTLGDRSSSGQTSGVYSRSKRLRQPTSTGQTSGAYRSGR